MSSQPFKKDNRNDYNVAQKDVNNYHETKGILGMSYQHDMDHVRNQLPYCATPGAIVKIIEPDFISIGVPDGINNNDFQYVFIDPVTWATSVDSMSILFNRAYPTPAPLMLHIRVLYAASLGNIETIELDVLFPAGRRFIDEGQPNYLAGLIQAVCPPSWVINPLPLNPGTNTFPECLVQVLGVTGTGGATAAKITFPKPFLPIGLCTPIQQGNGSWIYTFADQDARQFLGDTDAIAMYLYGGVTPGFIAQTRRSRTFFSYINFQGTYYQNMITAYGKSTQNTERYLDNNNIEDQNKVPNMALLEEYRKIATEYVGDFEFFPPMVSISTHWSNDDIAKNRGVLIIEKQ